MFSRFLWKHILGWTIVGSSLFMFAFYYQLQATWKPLFFASHDYFYYSLDDEEPMDALQTCQIPRIHPFDQSILEYLSPPKPIACKLRQLPLTFLDNNGVLKFNNTALLLSGYKKESLSCKFREIRRVSDNDNRILFGKEHSLPVNGTKLKMDFVSVSCYNFAGISFYSNIHAQIVKRIPVLRSSAQKKMKSEVHPFNILILGIDSLSRLSFIRNLPKTYHFLKHTMGSFVFRGMTKIGDNTFPNLAAILTGQSVFEEELSKVEGETYDSWPLAWKNFSERGYVTMFAEDRPDIALFNYLRGGFRVPPTDHYLRPYWLAVESSAVHRLSSHMCFGSVPKHILQLNYTRDFVIKYSKYKKNVSPPFFGFSYLVELSHDYVNQVGVVDDDLKTWLRDLYESGHLKRTFFFFLSDHGHRFDPMRATLVGRIEERMPFVSLYIPSSIRESQSQILPHLKTNLGRLTSPYDIYFTLMDILHHSTEGDQLGNFSSSLGTSLFGPISVNRTCLAAGIPEHYCVCEEEEILLVDDERAEKAGMTLTETVNSLLLSYYGNFSMCDRLSLSEIKRIDRIVPSRNVLVNSRVYFGSLLEDDLAIGMMSKLRVIIQTIPGEALFEATLIHREEENSMSVIGDISRINRYGIQSWCVDDATMRKFCHCVVQGPNVFRNFGS